ncbi:chemotaxis protein [Robbsia andropogonis]|uniref:Chemotaxis protein n=2 Tax=Robbsia andropogonis TaxID=28092 RepID=A0A0F5K023_9BURK|nr:methyl-accepting chemotaxis protein [Robbsia andropogonis]KKB63433.1 chemotaxis protein [Robbsia andropogonis]MCP1120401.1 methyl-accepting chemotaxis protein [Robbsia andropogonis]MCP1130245.1 methyl-accepting chemotaxis protein [Robbsia andropogonis]
MKGLKVSSRLALGFGLVLALLALLSALGFYSEKTLYTKLDEIARINNTEGRLANALKSTVRDRAIAIRNVALLTDQSQITQQIARIAAQDKTYQDTYDKLGQIFAQESGTTEREHRLFAQLKIDEGATKPIWVNAINLAQANDQAGATEVLIKQAWQKTSDWISRLDELANFEDELNEQAAAEAAATYATINSVTWAVIALAMAIGVVAAILITRSILRQLGGEPADAQTVAREIAGGNLMVEMHLTEGDTGSLMASLESMRRNLSEIVTGIKVSAESISVAAGEIAQGNVDLSQRTEEQAASLEETAASMEELTSTVRQNTDNARQGSTLAATASQIAAAGGEAVQKVVSTMEDISNSSTRVAEIISVIESIAFQTNILALNAAVEAARAGEQGRGFAVVAGEVRTLAQRSATAAKEIKDLISASVEHVSAGSRLVHDAGGTMNEVVRSVQRVTDIIGEVASASTEQSTGIEQVNVAVNQMDEVTQQNAALVEQASAAAQAMADQAQSLRDAVAIFQVKPQIATQQQSVQKPSTARRASPKKSLSRVPAQAPMTA